MYSSTSKIGFFGALCIYLLFFFLYFIYCEMHVTF